MSGKKKSQKNDSPQIFSGVREYTDERERREIRVGKFRYIPVAPPDSQQCRAVKGNPGHFKRYDRAILFQFKRCEIKPLFHNTIHRFPAADMLVLVTAAHMGQATLLERIECHRSGVMVSGKKIPALVGKPLPALQPEGLGSEIQGAAMHEKHSLIGPFHGHRIEYRQKRGIAELFMPVSTCRIAPADKDTVKKGVIVVAKYRYKAEFP
jgi:hypothetical protein